MFCPTSRMRSGTGATRLVQTRYSRLFAETSRLLPTFLKFYSNFAGVTLP